MIKKNKESYHNSPVIGDGGVELSDADNANITMYALSVFEQSEQQLVDLDNPQDVSDAIRDYFQNCAARGLRPGNLGLYAWLGLSKQDVSDAIRGKSKKLKPATIDLIKKAKLALASYREMLGSTGKINPVTLIFWQKNYDGLVDKQEIAIEPKQNDLQQMTPEDIAASVPELLECDMQD